MEKQLVWSVLANKMVTINVETRDEKMNEKCYEITMTNDEVRTIENVDVIKFSDGNLSAFNTEGDIVAHYQRDSYKYFQMVGS